jgi:N,N-dimethylformamidase
VSSIPVGYLDRWTARPGEHLALKVSSPAAYEVAVVRVVQGDNSPHAPDHREVPQGWWRPRDFPARIQPVAPGSHALSGPLPFRTDACRLSLELTFQPGTLAIGRPQVVAALLTTDGKSSLALALTAAGECELRLGGPAGRRTFRSAAGWAVRAGRWYRARLVADLEALSAEVDVVSIDRVPAGPQHLATRTTLQRDEAAWLRGDGRPGQLMLAAGSTLAQEDPEHFNGKIEAPVITASGGAAASVTLSWRLGPARPAVIDDDQGLHTPLTVMNTPATAVTGHRWDGTVLDFREDPAQYAALAFHEDDLTDAGWETTADIDLPVTLASGVYAVKLSAAAGERYIPFFVAPALGAARKRIAVLLSTFTYLAYANEHVREAVIGFQGTRSAPSRQDLEISAHRDFGLSLYDRHADGTGVCYSSTRRPVLNLDPSYRFWLFNGPVHLGEDLYLLDWLERTGHEYDVVTDHILHAEGASVLEGYSVVLTGSHPEYSSRQLLDALEEHVDRGGHLMYLGGNGFYWVTSVDPAAPHIIEIRRGIAGTRVWESPPGECYHSTTGEPGGLWRHRGRAPNRLVGVGFAAQGADKNAPGYRRVLPADLDEKWGFVFDGIAADEVIGAAGLLLGGAAGNEIDRADPSCGTPPDTVVLATSTGHSDAYQLAVEDMPLALPGQYGGTQQPLVRADMTITPHASGGCVFSVGAITWLGALAYNRYDNSVARLTGNVLARFLASPTLPGQTQSPEAPVS